MTNGIPIEVLEDRAANERRQLHNSVTELRNTVRDRLDVKKTARQHFVAASSMAAFVAGLFGYATGGMFSR
jgi:hypothetical protein